MKSLAKLQSEFLEEYEMTRGSSAKTIENYHRYLSHFIRVTNARKVSDITAEQVAAFCAQVAKQTTVRANGKRVPWKAVTINYHLSALRSFLKYLAARNIEALSPKQIALLPVVPSSPLTVSTDSLQQMKTLPKARTLEGKRDRAILHLLLELGLSTAAVCQANRVDVSFEDAALHVRRKNDTLERYHFSASTARVLRAYLTARPDRHEALFIRYGRKQHDGGDARLSPKAMQRLVAHYATLAGITAAVTPRLIRRQIAGSSR